MSDEYKNLLHVVKKQIDDISPSFCVAKWKQVTMHLHNGHTHSCHHPNPHLVPLDEIKDNPTALHNTNYKKSQRKLMLEGIRPSECQYCWNVEDSGDPFSDRIYKSAETDWARPYIQDIVSKPWDDNVDPSYVEVSFGNVCNFKCSYCSPQVSSQWMEEIERHGAYPTSTSFNSLDWLKNQNAMPIPNKDENPYVDAFWEWWPNMYNNLKHFRITGGEPLLNKNTFKILDYIIENPNTNLEVSINTNMNPPPEVFAKFLEKIKIIVEENKVKKFKIFTSAEAHGAQSEYIRHGMNYQTWLDNIHKTFEYVPNIKFTIMSTYNIFSLPSYTLFLKDVLDIKRKYIQSNIKDSPMMIDITYLRYPQHQTVFLIDDQKHLDMIQEQIDFIFANLESKTRPYDGFFEFEGNKLKRILNMLNEQKTNNDTKKMKKDFIVFVDEHDRRRGTNFLETFPELNEAYYRWKKLNE